MSPVGPSWYDVLGVDPDASTDEVRAAWRAAIADLDPSDRRFRSLNQAAEVLLDQDARAAYDAERRTPPPAAAPAQDLATDRDPAVDDDRAADHDSVASPAARPARVRTVRAPRPPGEKSRQQSRLPLVPAWVLLVLAALATLGVVTATVAVVQAGEPVAEDGGALVERSAEEARSAAVRAIVPVLSYDHRTLQEDAAAARSYMTQSYQEEKYDPLFSVIEENAPNTETVVGAQVVESAVVRTGDDRVDILLFVDRPTTNKQVSEPIVYKDQVTVTMARVEGQWLVDDLTTTPLAG